MRSPESCDESRGALNLGNVLFEKEKWPVGISESEVMQNVAVIGRSGAGKTNVVFHLIKQLTEKTCGCPELIHVVAV